VIQLLYMFAGALLFWTGYWTGKPIETKEPKEDAQPKQSKWKRKTKQVKRDNFPKDDEDDRSNLFYK